MPELKMPLNVTDIQSLIPHRAPFLLIDRILSMKVDELIVAQKNVSISDPILQGHFPGNPVMPGVLIIEAMAQASAVLGKLSDGSATNSCLLTEIGEARFRRLIVPGDILTIEVRVVKRRKPFFWFSGEARVGDEIAANVNFSARLA